MRTRVAGVVAVSALLAGCGEREASVVDRAFEQEIESAELSVDVKLTEGDAREPLGAFSLRGPFQAGEEEQLDRFDWRIRANGHHGERFAARVISTGENVFVRYGGKTYEVGEKTIDELEREAARQQKRGPQAEDLDDLQRLGLDLRSWFPESADEGPSRAAGVDTTRVTGRLDVSKALEDIAKLMEKPALRGQFEGQVMPRLGGREIAEIDDTISDPRMEIHVGREDGKFRRVAAGLRFEIPRRERDGAAFGNLAFAMELRNVDQPVAIDAPRRGRPIFELLRKLDSGAAPKSDAIEPS